MLSGRTLQPGGASHPRGPSGWSNPGGPTTRRPGAGLAKVGADRWRARTTQVPLYLRTHDQQLPGKQGLPPPPTAAVGLALFAQVALVRLWLAGLAVAPRSGGPPYHRLVCDALGLASSGYAGPFAQKSSRDVQTP